MTGRKWSDGELDEMARHDHDGLLTIVRATDESEASDADISFAAEIAGGLDTNSAYLALRAALVHRSPVVREGAIYGLSTMTIRASDRIECFRMRSTNPQIEPSPGVRAAAAEALEDDDFCLRMKMDR
jgi:hypothetical protein